MSPEVTTMVGARTVARKLARPSAVKIALLSALIGALLTIWEPPIAISFARMDPPVPSSLSAAVPPDTPSSVPSTMMLASAAVDRNRLPPAVSVRFDAVTLPFSLAAIET